MSHARWSRLAVLLAAGLALAFRLAALDARPMHHDEANQAIRFGQLLETGTYRYDAAEHHGPTLYYLTLPSAWLRGQRTTAALDERTLRLVPALFGAGTVLLLLPLSAGIGGWAVAFAAVLLAIAPPLTYYSRFYIQEALLLFFALGFLVAAGRYALEGRSSWARWAGVFAGLALATKETAVILLPAAVIACLVARSWRSRQPEPPGALGAREPTPYLASSTAGDLWTAVGVALAVAALFYSSFLTNPEGLAGPLRAAGIYLGRGVHPEAHRQAWDYYFRLLYDTSLGRVTGTDAGLSFAIVGAVAIAVRGTRSPGTTFWTRYLLLYAAAVTLVYSALPYKTPWNVVQFYAPWLVLAAIGAAAPLETSATRPGRILVAVAVVLVGISLGQQSRLANFRYPADPRNPYAYVHTSPDVVRLAARVRALAALHPDRERMLVAVVAAPSEQWPLPWYLRRMTRVGYWTSTESATVALGQAPVVIASPEHAAAVERALGARSQSEYYGLRPQILLSVFIERSLWDRFLDSAKQ